MFLANVPWVARHLDSKTHLTTKEEDVWEDCHDAGLLSWAVVYGDILHGTRSFNNVAQLHAATGAHLTKATEMLQARVEKVAREEGLGWDHSPFPRGASPKAPRCHKGVFQHHHPSHHDIKKCCCRWWQ